MLTTPLLEKYRKGDLVQYLNNVLEILTEERATTLKVAPQRAALEEVMQRFNHSWQPNRGSELTPQIQELDVERDNLFMGLKLTVDAWALHHYDEAKKNAAFLLSDAIAAQGEEVHRMRYQQETATLNALLLELKEELTAEVSLLGLTEWITKLEQVNTLFNEKYVARAQALSSEQDGLVQQLRIEATQAFRELKTLFGARMAIAKVEADANMDTYETVANELSKLTEQYNDAVLRAIERNKKEENGNENEGEQEEEVIN